MDILADFKEQLEILDPEVKEKAIEIALNLLKQEDRTPSEAVEEGIREAEQWYFDLEG